MTFTNPSDAAIRAILERPLAIAVVICSTHPNRDSHRIARRLPPSLAVLHPERVSVWVGVKQVRLRQQSDSCWFSMSCLITDSGAPPQLMPEG
ncbi:MAG: hypothetical protein ETSY2_08860 [Candidatus Entotheonella gemina]|uniref:Uncharacterized protein n=1 Tax=Candidatus Entotheonella gemina TaxID=1429439 RepID=W4MCB0_9BACT|nr:hypothetical protein [Candidatus Entotheonella palauensis]ETX07838.1 MAG: hypothetical protein ETSY2_08860 [Candidatus Entotheonella gemina]